MQTSPSSASDGSVPVGHTYDGIQEYDNPLPSWWKHLFIATILFSPVYLIIYHSGRPGSTQAEIHLAEKSENARKKYEKIGLLEANEETMIKYLRDDEWLPIGASIFQSNCVSCHRSDGGGNIGPNLCDDNYKNIKSIVDIYKVVNEGVGAGAMPAWGTRLGNKNDVVMVSIYVASLRGRTLGKQGKSPDGGVIPPWPIP